MDLDLFLFVVRWHTGPGPTTPPALSPLTALDVSYVNHNVLSSKLVCLSNMTPISSWQVSCVNNFVGLATFSCLFAEPRCCDVATVTLATVTVSLFGKGMFMIMNLCYHAYVCLYKRFLSADKSFGVLDNPMFSCTL